VITVEDLKLHLNLTTDTDDALLAQKIAAASAWVNSYTRAEPDAEDAPEPVKEAARQLAAHLYENREASLVGLTASELPFGLLELLGPYRAWSF
jgi:uncharacterized phage protein (predicted DNA packaging)